MVVLPVTTASKLDDARIFRLPRWTLQSTAKPLFSRFSSTWSPHIVGELNGQHVKLVKLEGDRCPWHAHANDDELFLVVDGRLEIQRREKTVTLNPGDFYIVPWATEHRVVPLRPTRVLLFEPATTVHTGNVVSEITRIGYERLA